MAKNEWAAVMEKLASVASIVANVGELCGTYGLKEDDLPVSLRSILESLHTWVLYRWPFSLMS